MAFLQSEFAQIYTQVRNNLQQSILSSAEFGALSQWARRSRVGAEIGEVLRKARQSLFRGGQGRFSLAESEAAVGRAVGWIAVETRTRNDRYANPFHEKLCKSYIVGSFFGVAAATAVKVKA